MLLAEEQYAMNENRDLPFAARMALRTRLRRCRSFGDGDIAETLPRLVHHKNGTVKAWSMGSRKGRGVVYALRAHRAFVTQRRGKVFNIAT